MSRVLTALRILLAALVLLEAAGVARALGHGADVSCCCGEHSAARQCHCHECPVLTRRAARAPQTARLELARDCDGAPAGDALLVVVALMPSPPAQPASPQARSPSIPPISMPPDRLIEAGRPPP